MSINLDTFLKIGHSHKICEDYIISGSEPMPHIILADGCSSSRNTEMGARLLCYMAKQFLTLKDARNSTYEQMGSWIINNAEMAARQLGLNSSSLDSTLIVSFYEEDSGGLRARFYGDGLLITIDQNDEIDYHEISFTNNSPFYLSYRLDNFRLNSYHSKKIDCIWNHRRWEGTPKSDNFEKSVSFAYDHQTELIRFAEQCKLFMICSDGITSFYSKEQYMQSENSYIEDVINEFTSFKNTTGSFLQRRVLKAIQSYEKSNVFHADDISLGAYLIQEVEECSTTSMEEK